MSDVLDFPGKRDRDLRSVPRMGRPTIPLTVVFYRHGSECLAVAVCSEREPLEIWQTEYFDRYHPDGYGTRTAGILEAPEGWKIEIIRADSCE